MSAVVGFDLAAWERLSRRASGAVAICEDLLAEIEGWLAEIPRCPVQHRGHDRNPRKTSEASGAEGTGPGLDGGPWAAHTAAFALPPQTSFASRAAWLAWCERDRRDEAMEIVLDDIR